MPAIKSVKVPSHLRRFYKQTDDSSFYIRVNRNESIHLSSDCNTKKALEIIIIFHTPLVLSNLQFQYLREYIKASMSCPIWEHLVSPMIDFFWFNWHLFFLILLLLFIIYLLEKIMTLFWCQVYLAGQKPTNWEHLYHSKVDGDLSYDRHTHIDTDTVFL